MGGYMPSEVARMVLGYLKETKCMKTSDTFLHESYNLKEYAECLKHGQEYPTTIAGRTLTQILQDYYVVTHLDLESKADKDNLISSLNTALSQVTYLVNAKSQTVEENRHKIVSKFHHGVNKRPSFARQQVRKKLRLAKMAAMRNIATSSKVVRVNFECPVASTSQLKNKLQTDDKSLGDNDGGDSCRNISCRESGGNSTVNSVEEIDNNYRNQNDRQTSNTTTISVVPQVKTTESCEFSPANARNRVLQNGDAFRSPHSGKQSTLQCSSCAKEISDVARSGERHVRNLDAIFRSPTSTPRPVRNCRTSSDSVPRNSVIADVRVANHHDSNDCLPPSHNLSQTRMQQTTERNQTQSPKNPKSLSQTMCAVTTNANSCQSDYKLSTTKENIQQNHSKNTQALKLDKNFQNVTKTYQRIQPTPVTNCLTSNNNCKISAHSQQVFHPPILSKNICTFQQKTVTFQQDKPNDILRDAETNSFRPCNTNQESVQFENDPDENLSPGVASCNNHVNEKEETLRNESVFENPLELVLSDAMACTPRNTVQPDLPARFPETDDSPRYILSQQRAAVPSLTTPVKELSDHNFYSPRRKSLIPRRRLLPTSSPLVSQQPQQETEPIFEELINFPQLIEKIAENINKVVHPATSEIEAAISQEIHAPDDAVIKDILQLTESESVFEEALYFLCEKYDVSRDGVDGTVDATEGSTPKSDQPASVENNPQESPDLSNNEKATEESHQISSSPVCAISTEDNANNDLVAVSEAYVVCDNIPQISIPENVEIILTNENFLTLKNAAEACSSAAGVHVAVQPSNAVATSESGTCIQVWDKPIMSTTCINPPTNGAYFMNAAAITPMKITIPDFRFLTLSPSHIFGMPTFVADQTALPDKKSSQPTILPKTSNLAQSQNISYSRQSVGQPSIVKKKPEVNVLQKITTAQNHNIRANRKNVLQNHGHRELKQQSFETKKKDVSIKSKQEERRGSSKVSFGPSNIISTKNRISRSHIRNLDFGSVSTEGRRHPSNRQKEGKNSSSESSNRNGGRAANSRNKVVEDADQVVAATLVSMAHSTNESKKSSATKIEQNKKRKDNTSNDEQLKKKRIQENLLKGMDVDKFLSKIHS